MFGVGAGVGTLIDGGLVAAVSTLQGQVATIQTELTSLVGEGLADNALQAFDEAGDVINGSSNAFQGLRSFANCFSRLRSSLQGYQQVATVAANPLSGAVVL